jgi:hypothetical protein
VKQTPPTRGSPPRHRCNTYASPSHARASASNTPRSRPLRANLSSPPARFAHCCLLAKPITRGGATRRPLLVHGDSEGRSRDRPPRLTCATAGDCLLSRRETDAARCRLRVTRAHAATELVVARILVDLDQVSAVSSCLASWHPGILASWHPGILARWAYHARRCLGSDARDRIANGRAADVTR